MILYPLTQRSCICHNLRWQTHLPAAQPGPIQAATSCLPRSPCIGLDSTGASSLQRAAAGAAAAAACFAAASLAGSSNPQHSPCHIRRQHGAVKQCSKFTRAVMDHQQVTPCCPHSGRGQWYGMQHRSTISCHCKQQQCCSCCCSSDSRTSRAAAGLTTAAMPAATPHLAASTAQPTGLLLDTTTSSSSSCEGLF